MLKYPPTNYVIFFTWYWESVIAVALNNYAEVLDQCSDVATTVKSEIIEKRWPKSGEIQNKWRTWTRPVVITNIKSLCLICVLCRRTSKFQGSLSYSFIGLWRRYVICRNTLLTLDFVQWWIINTPFRKPTLLPFSCAKLFGVPFSKTDSQSLGQVTSAISFFNHII